MTNKNTYYHQNLGITRPLSEGQMMSESQAYAAMIKSLRELGFEVVEQNEAGLVWEKDGKLYRHATADNSVTLIK